MVDICGGTSLSAPVFASLLSEYCLDLLLDCDLYGWLMLTYL